MKRIPLSIAIFLISISSLISQGVGGLTPCFEYAENFSTRSYSGGFQADIKVSDNIALSYKFLIGGSTGKTLYAHAPVGSAAGVVLLNSLSGLNSKFVNGLGILLIIIPEGITYYPDPDKRIKAGMYLTPLGCDYWYRNPNYEYFRMSGEAGGKMKIPVDDNEKVYFQLNAGVRYLYRNKAIDPLFLTAGAGLSFTLK